MLEARGYAALTAADADAALAALAVRAEIAVVLSDGRMPGCNGFAGAEQARPKQLQDRAAEVILLDGHAPSASAQHAVHAGALDILCKPLRLAALATVVGRAMARALERRGAALATAQYRLECAALHAAAPIGLGRIGRALRLAGSNAARRDLLGLMEESVIADLWASAPAIRAELERALLRIPAGGPGAAPSGHNGWKRRSTRSPRRVGRIRSPRPALPASMSPPKRRFGASSIIA